MTTTEQVPDILQPVIDAVAQALAVEFYRQETGDLRHAETPEIAAQWWADIYGGERQSFLMDAHAAVQAIAPALADAWEQGMIAAKLAAAGIKPARNPYNTQETKP